MRHCIAQQVRQQLPEALRIRDDRIWQVDIALERNGRSALVVEPVPAE